MEHHNAEQFLFPQIELSTGVIGVLILCVGPSIFMSAHVRPPKPARNLATPCTNIYLTGNGARLGSRTAPMRTPTELRADLARRGPDQELRVVYSGDLPSRQLTEALNVVSEFDSCPTLSMEAKHEVRQR